jgi:hypothetical protein
LRPSLDHQLSVQDHCTAARPLIAQFGANESHFSDMSIPFSQGKLQGKERKNVLQAVQKQAEAAARAAIRPVVQEFLESEVSAKLGREKGEPRHSSGQPREIESWHDFCCLLNVHLYQQWLERHGSQRMEDMGEILIEILVMRNLSWHRQYDGKYDQVQKTKKNQQPHGPGEFPLFAHLRIISSG